ncbi:MAG: hypothetical protein A2X86_01515 [Bdellovibrionales bacterium GWA2_49_15]|nr:MAG: hypothetical protein A2X86_01515 [Bdellovibrionales bacterium GWA2_49_15]
MKQSPARPALKDLRKSIKVEQAAILDMLTRLKNQIEKKEFEKLEHLFAHISECQCHEYQADGSPCLHPEIDCHDCQSALDDLSQLRQSLNHDFKLE